MGDNEHPTTLVTKGKALLARHLPERAAAEFNRALAIDPCHVAALRGRASISLNAGNNDEAISDLARAIDIDPADPASWQARADAYLEDDQPDRALDDYSVAIRLGPQMIELYDRRAAAYLFKRKFEDAIADYNEMTRLAPGDSLPYQRRGELYAHTGDYPRALSEFTQAISYGPTSQHHRQRASVHEKLGDHHAALADLNEAIRIDPNSPDAYQARHKIWTALGDRARAGADYDESLRLGATQSCDMHCKRAMEFERENDPEGAAAEFKLALANYDALLRTFPQNALLLYRRGFLHLKLGDKIRAKDDISTAQMLSPSIPERAEALAQALGVREESLELPATSVEERLWSYIHGDTEERAFETWVYGSAALEEALGAEDYLAIASLDFGDARKAAVWERIEAVRKIAKRHFPRSCRCAELKSLAFVNMGSHEEIFASLKLVRRRGPSKWWLAAHVCEDCGQAWLVVQEERITDTFILRKIAEPQMKLLAERNEWPNEFETWAQVLEHLPGRLHPQDLLVATMADLAREQPGIPVSKLASILKLDMATADTLARRAIADQRVSIALPEDADRQSSTLPFAPPKTSSFWTGRRFELTRRLWAFPVVTASWAYYFGNLTLSIGCGFGLLCLLLLDLVAIRRK